MGFCGDYDTEFTTHYYHLVRNKVDNYKLNFVDPDYKPPEPILFELRENDSYPNEPNRPSVQCIKIVPGDTGRFPERKVENTNKMLQTPKNKRVIKSSEENKSRNFSGMHKSAEGLKKF